MLCGSLMRVLGYFRGIWFGVYRYTDIRAMFCAGVHNNNSSNGSHHNSSRASTPSGSPSRSNPLERCLRTLTDTLIAQGQLQPGPGQGSPARRPSNPTRAPSSPLRLFGFTSAAAQANNGPRSDSPSKLGGVVALQEMSQLPPESKDDSDSGCSTPDLLEQAVRARHARVQGMHLSPQPQLGEGKLARAYVHEASEALEGLEEDCAHDNMADSIEYMLALSPLGLKYVLETAGAASVSYLPTPPPLEPGAESEEKEDGV
jgi:hypothetical protein